MTPTTFADWSRAFWSASILYRQHERDRSPAVHALKVIAEQAPQPINAKAKAILGEQDNDGDYHLPPEI